MKLETEYEPNCVGLEFTSRHSESDRRHIHFGMHVSCYHRKCYAFFTNRIHEWKTMATGRITRFK